jgi:hypothetical protein
MAAPQGNETRSTMLPTEAPSGLGFFGTPYSPADSLKTPAQLGVKTGDSLGDVVNAVKGVAFYTDTIGFGESSTPLSAGMGLQPLGINYFMKTGQRCSNGADMYDYFQGIPEGTALGTKAANALKEMGLPGLRGLAPAMLEDTEKALNPEPLLAALFGSGYPQCKLVTRQVGDLYGKIRDTDGTVWIEDPDSAVKGSDGLYYQTRWILDKNIDKATWEAEPKTYNPDGTPKKKEGFVTGESGVTAAAAVAVLALCILGFGLVRKI